MSIHLEWIKRNILHEKIRVHKHNPYNAKPLGKTCILARIETPLNKCISLDFLLIGDSPSARARVAAFFCTWEGVGGRTWSIYH